MMMKRRMKTRGTEDKEMERKVEIRLTKKRHFVDGAQS